MDWCQRHLATLGAGLHYERAVTLSDKMLAMSMAMQTERGRSLRGGDGDCVSCDSEHDSG